MLDGTSERRGWASLYYGPVPLVAAFVLTLAILQWCWPLLATGQKYTDLVVGHITWGDQDKTRDFRALGIFVASIGLCTLGISALFRWVGPDGPKSDVGRGLTGLLLCSMLPVAWWFGSALARAENCFMPRPAMTLVLIALLTVAALRRYRHDLTSRIVMEVGGAVLLLAVLSFFGGIGVAMLLTRAFPKKLMLVQDYGSWFGPLKPAGAALAWAALTFCLSPNVHIWRRRLARALIWVQIPLPFLFCTLIPAPMFIGDTIQAAPVKIALPLVIAGLTLIVWITLVRFYRTRPQPETAETLSFTTVLSSLALSAIPIFMMLPASYYPYLQGDHFHWGEQLLPWQQMINWGKVPYTDFIPIHGLMAMLRGFFNEVFFDGTAAYFGAGDYTLAALWIVATFLAARSLIGPVAALFLGLYGPAYDRFFFLIPGLLILGQRRLLDRPGAWMSVWCVLVPLQIAYNAAIGPAFLLGTAPAAAWMAWRLFRTNRGALLRLGALLGAAALVLACTSPARLLCIDFLRFLSENGATNDVANGITFESNIASQPSGGIAAGYLLWETLRYSWMFVVAFAALLFFRELAKPPEERNRQLAWLCAVIVPTLLLMTPWTIGRIDFLGASRIGALSQVAVTFLLPVLVLVGRPLSAKPVQAVFLVLAATFFIFYGNGKAARKDLMAKPFAHITIPVNELTDGPGIGLPKLGQVFLTPDTRAELTELKQIVDSWLKPGETFLDMTNRSAYYYYLNLPVPGRYSAPYVAASSDMQARELRRLETNPPPLILLAPDRGSDGGSGSLRSYLMYRTYALRYVPVRRGRFLFLADPERVPEADMPERGKRIKMLSEMFYTANLQYICAAWGRSWSTLADRFDVVADHIPQQPLLPRAAPASTAAPVDAGLTLGYDLAELGLSGREADYLKIDLACDLKAHQPHPELKISWESSDHVIQDGAVLRAAGPCLLVPLGSYPSWLLTERLGSLQIRLADPKSCPEFAIREMQLLRLKSGK